jgi:heme-binding NEAT domain protein
VTVTAAGKQFKATHVINQTTPGNKVNVEIPVTGLPLGVAAKVEVFIQGVPGENDLENNKGEYLAIFSS